MKKPTCSLLVLTALFALALLPAVPAIALTADEWVVKGVEYEKKGDFKNAARILHACDRDRSLQ